MQLGSRWQTEMWLIEGKGWGWAKMQGRSKCYEGKTCCHLEGSYFGCRACILLFWLFCFVLLRQVTREVANYLKQTKYMQSSRFNLSFKESKSRISTAATFQSLITFITSQEPKKRIWKFACQSLESQSRSA